MNFMAILAATIFCFHSAQALFLQNNDQASSMPLSKIVVTCGVSESCNMTLNDESLKPSDYSITESISSLKMGYLEHPFFVVTTDAEGNFFNSDGTLAGEFVMIQPDCLPQDMSELFQTAYTITKASGESSTLTSEEFFTDFLPKIGFVVKKRLNDAYVIATDLERKIFFLSDITYVEFSAEDNDDKTITEIYGWGKFWGGGEIYIPVEF
ncbi:MAG: hypothetical protein P9X27_06805 [Candidatus Kaelpia aquatica]|nr:hypothetical protein [Candidatus Kaelpia aquatica]